MMLHAYYLRIPTNKELIEVSAPDPFVPTLDINWAPHCIVQHLDKLIKELRDKSIRAMEEERQEKLLRNPAPELSSKAKKPETEEARTKCEQWLSEWALE